LFNMMKRGADFFFHSEVWYRICKQKNKERERENTNWIGFIGMSFCSALMVLNYWAMT